MNGYGALVELAEVTKRFDTAKGAITALDNLTAHIPEGRLTGLIGPDGAGKSTLMRLVAGLLAPSAGEVRVFGTSALKLGGEQRRAIGYLPQGTGLYRDLTLGENLNLHADLRGLAGARRHERIDDLLGRLGLAEFWSRPAGKLSGGMAQKLGLACALVEPPRLLLLDEPSTGVDPLSRRELWSIVRDLRDEGITVLWSTAYLDEANGCDRVIVLAAGEKLFEGAPEDFTARVEGRTWRLDAPQEALRSLQRRAIGKADIVDAVLRSGYLHLVTAEDVSQQRCRDLLADDAADMRIDVQPAPPRFEDAVIAELTRNREGAEPDHEPETTAAQTRKTVAADGPAIRARDLVRRFGDFTAVDGVSFEVARGEVFGLLGPNGAGKSTTFRMLCGLLAPSDGLAEVAGRDIGRAGAAARARIGYMAQHFSLYANLTVYQNLRFFASAYGLGRRARRDRIDRLSDELDLARHGDQPSGALPLGVKQRLSLAAAILHEPEILFLDEPTSGVDPLIRRDFWMRINAMAGKGVAVLVTTHLMEEAEFCDRIGIIERGVLIGTDTPRKIAETHSPDDAGEVSVEEAFIALISQRRAERREGAA